MCNRDDDPTQHDPSPTHDHADDEALRHETCPGCIAASRGRPHTFAPAMKVCEWHGDQVYPCPRCEFEAWSSLMEARHGVQ